jgi:hypothetical protein
MKKLNDERSTTNIRTDPSDNWNVSAERLIVKGVVVRALSAIGLASLLAGCTTPSGRPDNTANGALIGGASGAAIGALADHHNPGAGALIGGTAGLIAGGLIGHSMDQQAEARRQSLP